MSCGLNQTTPSGLFSWNPRTNTNGSRTSLRRPQKRAGAPPAGTPPATTSTDRPRSGPERVVTGALTLSQSATRPTRIRYQATVPKKKLMFAVKAYPGAGYG